MSGHQLAPGTHWTHRNKQIKIISPSKPDVYQVLNSFRGRLRSPKFGSVMVRVFCGRTTIRKQLLVVRSFVDLLWTVVDHG
jgi:Fe-S oxidoreductase